MSRLLKFAVIALAFAAAGPAAAETLYRVNGVKSDDQLNVRTKPDAKSEIVRELPFWANGLKVLRKDGDWAEISEQFDGAETTLGWVNAKFLTEDATPAQLETPLFCHGSEPGWTITLGEGDKASIGTPDGESSDTFSIKPDGNGAEVSFAKGGAGTIKADSTCGEMGGGTWRYYFTGTLPVAGDPGNNFQLAGCCR